MPGWAIRSSADGAAGAETLPALKPWDRHRGETDARPRVSPDLHLHRTGRLVSADLPHRWRITAEGDLNGQGEWRLDWTAEGTRAVYDWQVTADRPLFRLLSPLFGWLLAANHRWAMTKGEAGIRRELVRRRGEGVA